MKKSELQQIIKEEIDKTLNVKRTATLDIDGNEIQSNDKVELVDADIKDGNGTPLPGNVFKILRVNPKTITIEPTFSTWLRQVVLDSNKVRLLK
jgi:hypothetical protein